MKTIIPFLLVLTLIGLIAHAAPSSALTVAVYDFKGDGAAASYGKNVTTLVTANLTTETNLVMLERVELSQALSEQAFGVSGLVNSVAAAQNGQITGAKILVAGQVMKTGDNHLVIVANIVGTETGRLFASKVEGSADNLTELTATLSRKIAQTISDQAKNLIAATQESSEERLDRIIKNLAGTNRPSVSVEILMPSLNKGHLITAEGELGRILLKSRFAVVDARSDRKPDVEITGVLDISAAPRHGEMFSFRAVIDLKIQERRSGTILAFDHQEGNATGTTEAGANRSAQVNAVDLLAERILPLLAK